MLQPEFHNDQAAGLREHLLREGRPVRTLAVTGGKGGVGKTTVAINLALTLARRGREVMLLDTDLALANVNVLLGIAARRNLGDVLSGECSLQEVVVRGPHGLQVVPGASGIAELADLSTTRSVGLINAFNELTAGIDDLVIDTAAGISDSVLRFASASREVAVVVCDDPASITDAYALIKVLNRDHKVDRFTVITNMTSSATHGQDLFERLARVTARFLRVQLVHFGNVPRDTSVRKAIQSQVAVVERYPDCRAARAFSALAKRHIEGGGRASGRGNIEFFSDRMLGTPREACA